MAIREATQLPARDRSDPRTGRRLRKRLDVARAAEHWSAQLPLLIEQQLRTE
jgi:hypothetical protein